MSKYLVVVDMQNDFIDGSLGTPEAQAIVPKVVEKIKQYKENGYQIIFTMDTHTENYLETQEGKYLPIKHCVFNESGWKIYSVLEQYINQDTRVFPKGSFGSFDLLNNMLLYKTGDVKEIELCGLCTDICVIANALILKSFIQETKIVVDSNCCAGTTPENHNKALDVMRSCQIEII